MIEQFDLTINKTTIQSRPESNDNKRVLLIPQTPGLELYHDVDVI